MRYAFLAVLLAALSVGAQAQSIIPVNLIDANNHHVRMILPVPHRTADRSWWLWTAASGALTFADVANTRYCLRLNACAEANPIWGGPHPSAALQYSVTGSVFALTTYLSYRSKRRNDAAKAFGATISPSDHWWIWPLMNSAVHAFGTGYTIGNSGR